MGSCTFGLAWRGQCKATCEGSVCTQHAAVKCCVCGGQATHECGDHIGQFVCGMPLCKNCEGQPKQAPRREPGKHGPPTGEAIHA